MDVTPFPSYSKPGNDADAAEHSISAVERETGLGKDTLRIWEKRYGFPSPLRDQAGDRKYSSAQVRQLKLVRRLLDTGLRPSRVVGLDEASLHGLLTEREKPSPAILSRTISKSGPDTSPLADLMQTLGSTEPHQLRLQLSQALLRLGMRDFVIELVAPLTIHVGEAWAQGRIEIYEEHLYTEVLTSVLRQALGGLTAMAHELRPRVLLTTLPQEPHGLGLLMVEALLSLEACACISLGTQTPVIDIAQAAALHRADVVALSLSSLQHGEQGMAGLAELRALLPPRVALWAGGACAGLYRRPMPGIVALQHLAGLQPLVAQWRRDAQLPDGHEPALPVPGRPGADRFP